MKAEEMDKESIDNAIVSLINNLTFVKQVDMFVVNNEAKQLVVVFKGDISLAEIPDLEEYALATKDVEEFVNLSSAFDGDNILKTIKGGGKVLFFDLKTNLASDKVHELDLKKYAEGGMLTTKPVTYSSDPVLEIFMTALEHEGNLYRNPLNPREYVFKNIATLNFNRFNVPAGQKTVWLTDIMTVDKRQGYGNAVMESITRVTDRLGYEIKLEAFPFSRSKKALDKVGLLKFYTKHGFEVNADEYGWSDAPERYVKYYIDDESASLMMNRTPR